MDEGSGGGLRDNAVAEDVETVAVHLSGHPIIHSTNRGFRWSPTCPPVATSLRGREFVPRYAPFFQSRACGVGSRPRRAIVSSDSRIGPTRPIPPPRFEPYEEALGVGSKEEDTIADMGGPHGRRRNAVPLRRPPALGQVAEYSSETSPRKVAWDVLQEREPGSHLANDAPDFAPEPPLIVRTLPIASDGIGLAGIARGDEVDSTGQSATIEGRHVKPDWSRGQRPVLHARRQDLHSTGIPLAVSEDGRGGQLELGEGEGEGEAMLETAGPAAE